MRIELSKKGDYAVRAAVGLATLDDGHPVSARIVAERMDIPPRFVAHVLSDLVRAGVVVGTPGRSGGYRLAAPAESIDLLRIVDAVEDRGTAPRCVIRGGACRSTGSVRRPRRIRGRLGRDAARVGVGEPRRSRWRELGKGILATPNCSRRT